jgi:hypothetical protein
MSQDNRAWRLSGEPARQRALSPTLVFGMSVLEILSFVTVNRINSDQSKPCTHRQLDIPFVSLVSVMGENDLADSVKECVHLMCMIQCLRWIVAW